MHLVVDPIGPEVDRARSAGLDRLAREEHDGRPDAVSGLRELRAAPGLKLVGFSLWRSAEGEIYVTFPSRAFGAGQERRYFDYLRAVDAGAAATKALREAIVAAYRPQGEPTA